MRFAQISRIDAGRVMSFTGLNHIRIRKHGHQFIQTNANRSIRPLGRKKINLFHKDRTKSRNDCPHHLHRFNSHPKRDSFLYYICLMTDLTILEIHLKGSSLSFLTNQRSFLEENTGVTSVISSFITAELAMTNDFYKLFRS